MGDMDDGFRDEDLDLDKAPLRTPRKPNSETLLRELDRMERKIAVKGIGDDVDRVLDVVTSYLGDEVFAQRFVDCMEIIKRKNADYSQNEAKRDRVAAFKRIARDIDVPVRKAWAVFAQKHWGAVMRYVKDGLLESEPIDGRINDLINYLVLFGAIVSEERFDAKLKKAGGR